MLLAEHVARSEGATTIGLNVFGQNRVAPLSLHVPPIRGHGDANEKQLLELL